MCRGGEKKGAGTETGIGTGMGRSQKKEGRSEEKEGRSDFG